MKTLTKKQLLELLEPLSDEAQVTLYLELDDLEQAKANLPKNRTLIEFGLPGDHSVGDDGIGFLLWTGA